MKPPVRFQRLEEVKLPGKELHLAVGMFDGVHLGHQSVIQSAIHAARAANGLAGVLTFWPHPSQLFRPENPTPQITDPAIKDRLLARQGVDFIVCQPFTRDFASISATEFLPFLQRCLPQLAAIYVGENWRFGRGRKGDVPFLVEEGKKRNVHIVSVPRLHFDGAAISSTRIRECLARGEIETVNRLLGYAYFSAGTAREGKKLGSQIGFPTLNIHWDPSLRPCYGVYVVRAAKAGGGRFLPAVANYGVRPTVGEGSAPLLEVHLLDKDCPYGTGDELCVEWLHLIRREKRFENLEKLAAQIARDKETAARYFANKGA